MRHEKSDEVLVAILHTRPDLYCLSSALTFYTHALKNGFIDENKVKVIVVHDKNATPALLALIDEYKTYGVTLMRLPFLYKVRLKLTHEIKDRLNGANILIKYFSYPLLFLARKNWLWHSSYGAKVAFAISYAKKNDFEFILKYDEDIALLPKSWKRLTKVSPSKIEDDVLLITPSLSTGIPSWKYFLEHPAGLEAKNLVGDILNKAKMPDFMWGVDYSSISKINKEGVWAEDEYELAVRQLSTRYRGFHPIRFSAEACAIIAENSIKKLNEFLADNNGPMNEKSYIESRDYLCNNLFLIRTKDYSKLIRNSSIFLDPFDELPINYLFQYGQKKYLIDTEAIGFHYLYSTAHSKRANFFGQEYKGLDLESAIANAYESQLKKYPSSK
jgi:hypothetical protein